MKYTRILFTICLAAILGSCTTESEITNEEPDFESFRVEVSAFIDSSTDKGLTIGDIRPGIDMLAQKYNVEISHKSPEIDDTELKTQSKAFCWPWEERSVELITGECWVFVHYCDGEYESTDWLCDGQWY